MCQQPALQHSTENIETCFHFGICHIHQLQCFYDVFSELSCLCFLSDGVHLNSVFMNLHFLNPDTCSRGLAAVHRRKGSNAALVQLCVLLSTLSSHSLVLHRSPPLCSSFNLSTLSLPISPLWKSGSFSE